MYSFIILNYNPQNHRLQMMYKTVYDVAMPMWNLPATALLSSPRP